MAKDAGLRTVVTTKRLKEKLDGVLGKDATIDIESEDGKLSGYPKTNIPAEVSGLTSSNLAYVIYTSGSTGRPKGVMVEHRSVTALIQSISEEFELTSGVIMLQFASLNFDASVEECFGALSTGATMVLRNEDCLTSTLRFWEFCDGQKINFVDLPTSFFHLLLSSDPSLIPPVLNTIVTGGEALNTNKLKYWFKTGYRLPKLINTYGPTEATVTSTIYEIINFTDTIGKPISNTSLYVLDVNRQRVPVGVAGELYIGGAGVARGYLNRPELTAERFVENTFGDDPNDRLYRTGDLVKYLPDGNLVFLGRMDHQVKLRGFRIELGEIENVLSGNGTVQNAVATLHNNEHLVAYVAVGDTDKLAENFNAELLEYAKGLLPEYMVPSFIVPLDKLPLNANGKVDRKALPDPDVSKMQQEYVAPSTETETVLAGIWEKLLGVERVGLNDNFFHLGGHSLLATRLMGKIREAFNLEIPLKVLFEKPTIKELVKELETAKTSELPPILPVSSSTRSIPSFSQQRLWFIEQLDPGNPKYNMAEGLLLEGSLHTDLLIESITHIVQRHEVLRTVYRQTEQHTVLEVLPAHKFQLPLEDISGLSSKDQHKRIRQRLQQQVEKGFDLTKDLMLRVSLLKLDEASHALLFCMHHIASDGWSIGVLVKELQAIYGGTGLGKSDQPTSPTGSIFRLCPLAAPSSQGRGAGKLPNLLGATTVRYPLNP